MSTSRQLRRMGMWALLALCVSGTTAPGAAAHGPVARGTAAARTRAEDPRGAAQAPGAPDVVLTPIASSLQDPTYIAGARDNSGRLFVVQRRGTIVVFKNGTFNASPFLDIRGKVAIEGTEQGLLGLAFHPQFAANGRFFVLYTSAADNSVVVSEFHAAPGSDTASPTEKPIISVPHPDAPYHNGGQIEFGPDGYLYIGIGDGGPQNDPNCHGQDTSVLLSKMLRLDIDHGVPYTTPADNPYAAGGGAAGGGRPEIYAIGLRNPYRFSFDSRPGGDGALYLGDPGQSSREEVDVVVRGGNYGWPVMEGTTVHPHDASCTGSNFLPPFYEYDHSRDVCNPSVVPDCQAIIGGYVYRGSRIPGLVGTYLFADYCYTSLYGLKNGVAECLVTGPTATHITSFGESDDGEIYVCGYNEFDGSGVGFLERLDPVGSSCGLTCPADVSVVDADGDGAEVVSFAAPQTSGACGTVTCAPASGSSFAVGVTDVTCSSSSGGASCSFAVTVESPNALSVLSVAPSSGRHKSSVDVTIAGTGFASGATVSFGPKITVLSTTVVSATEIHVRIKIKKKAARGARDVVVANPDGASAAKTGAFTVT